MAREINRQAGLGCVFPTLLSRRWSADLLVHLTSFFAVIGTVLGAATHAPTGAAQRFDINTTRGMAYFYRDHMLATKFLLGGIALDKTATDPVIWTKPRRYAEAGIRHFWRIENDSGWPVAYVYELDPATRTYMLAGIFHEQLKVPVPFPVDLSLTALSG
jgi:hypothetical protein